MSNSPLSFESVTRTIAEQWDRNACIRFEELSSRHDRTYKDVLCPILHKLLQDASQGRAVLDAGCGLGFFSEYMRQQGFDVTGVDMSRRCISIANETFPRVKFFNGTIIEFSEGAADGFNACVANMLFHNVPNIEEVGGAIFRLLKAKGVLVGCIPHPNNWFDRRSDAAKRVNICGQVAYLMPFQIRGSLRHPALFTYFERKCIDYWRALARAGFSEVQAVSFEKNIRVPDDLVFFLAKKS